MADDSTIAAVLAALAVAAFACALFGAGARALRQPPVIGQILAGIALGPSLLGRLPGDPTARLFPAHVLPYLGMLGQVAVTVFMFSVGYELTAHRRQAAGRAVAAVAAGALVVPMGLGAAMAVLGRAEFGAAGEPHAGSGTFVLFLAVAVSITALPVLAAIVRDRDLDGTRAGTVALASSGLMDVVAWLTLAAITLGAGTTDGRRAGVQQVGLRLVLLLALAAALLGVVRPLLRRWMRGSATVPYHLPVAFALAAGAAAATTALGLHAVFGGLLAGAAMPHPHAHPDPRSAPSSGSRSDRAAVPFLTAALHAVESLLLPLFFVTTGLALDVGALRPGDFVLLAVVCAVACAGKLGGGYVGARFGGLPRRPSATVAVLLNTRGLTELIALNLGLASGVIHKRLFTVLVLMAVITTLMTSPLLTALGDRANPRRKRGSRPVEPAAASTSAETDPVSDREIQAGHVS
ncbi:cation:proton antiporter [Streptomyces sp. NPDC096132]|uniref:cation:proton antiporter n=1 Tax=Streptomyces sp. NPDC096132 TaxID=3366075 RepID=UPI0038131C03